MKIKLILLLTILTAAQFVPAQTSLDSLGNEELFRRARDLTFNSRRDSARVLLAIALRQSPNYADIRIFYARTLAWDGMRNEARKELRMVLDQKPFNVEALLFAIDVELWDDAPEEALRICVTGLRKYPNNEQFLVNKAKILRSLKREDEALITLAILEDLNPSNPEVPRIRESIKSDFVMQGISVGETYDRYSKVFDPNHLVAVQYNRSTYFGSVIGRLNYRNTRGKDGLQFEIDAYPRIISGVYAYVSYGFAGSSSSLFSQHRAGLEGFVKLPSSFEGSFGARYLNFGPGSDITIYTGSLGYYYKDYWFSLRPFVTPGSVSFSRSLSATTRWYYDGTAEEYASMKAGAGFSPDERNYDPTSGNIYLLKARSFGIGWQKPLGVYSLLNIAADYTRQELSFSLGEYVEVYSFSFSYRYKF